MLIQTRMSQVVKPNMYRIYLNEDQSKLLIKICKETELSQPDLLSKVAVAGLRCIEDNEFQIVLPLKFKIRKPTEETARVESTSTSKAR